jgi:hypothetical protein
MLYYFKADQQTSLNIILIGAGALFFVLIDWLLFLIPKPLLIMVALAALGGSGYFGYMQKSSITDKISGAPPSLRRNIQQAEVQPQILQKEPERPATKEELTATRQMIEMIKKEKEMREKKREEIFSKFGAKEEGLKKIEPFKRIAPVKKKIPAKIEKQEIKPSKPEEKSAIQKVSEISKPSKSAIEELGKFGKSDDVFSQMSRLKRKNEAFEKLSSISKSKIEDVFKKLPSSKKGIEELSEIEKKKKRKK